MTYLGIAGVCLLLIVWMGWRLRMTSAPLRVRRDRADAGKTASSRRGESGVATIEFVLVAPFLLTVTLILIQTMLVFTGLFYVNYAAYAAARSAIVYIPADVAPDGPNVLTPSEGLQKFDHIRAAAVIAVMPVSGQEEGGLQSAPAVVAGLNRFFNARGVTAPNWVDNLAQGRLNYAAAHTAVNVQTVRQLEDGTVLFDDVTGTTTFGPKDAVAVQVRHEFALTVPLASQIFKLTGSGDDGANSGTYSPMDRSRRQGTPPPPGTWTVIRARAVLTNEGITRTLPDPPRVPRRQPAADDTAADPPALEFLAMTALPTPATPRRRRPLRARSARQRGVVIIIAVLATFLIAGMIGYVFNTGRHAQLRQETQNAADATAVSGAGYIARSFNTVAMNNVEVSRLIAVVQMLDSVPLAVEYTLADEEATLDTVEDQLRRGGMDPWVRDQMRQIQADLVQQIAVLWEMDQFFNHSGYDVREMTFYDSEFGRGELWKAMESLDAISQATMENVGELAQYNAQETGRDNMHHQGENTAAFIAPFEPTFLWTRYRFDDYRLPVVAGRLPDWVDDEITNRGPYDTIFGWHAAQREDVEIPNPDRGSERVTDNFGSRWSGGTGRGGGSITISSRVTSYTTFGTWQWLGRVLRDRVDGSFENQGPLFNSQFVTRVNRMGGNKLNVVWPGSAQQWEFLDPQWITDYEEARAIIEAGSPRAAYTQFIRMDFEQVYYDGIPTTSEPILTDWTILRPRGGRLNVPGLPKTGNHTWQDQAELVGTTPDGVEVRTVLTREFVWAGMNVGPRIELRNPNNFSSRADLPAPIDFMHELMFRPQDGAVGRPGEPFAILGVAKQPSTASMWPRLFRSTAYDGHVAIAQAGIFNNHSWDLWTQMWHAQLEPVQDFSGWVTVMQTDPGALSGYPDLSPGEVEEIAEYLRSVEELAPVLLNHQDTPTSRADQAQARSQK